MPFIRVETSATLDDAARAALLKQLSGTLAEISGKAEQYVMASMTRADMLMAGEEPPAAFVDVRGIGGLDKATNQRLSEALCAVLGDALAVPADRVYITFTDVAATNWGWRGDTFG